MGKSIILLLYVSILVSCSIPNRIIKKDDPNDKIKSFKLIQTPDAYSLGKKSPVKGRSYFNVTSTYLFEEKENGRPEITVNFRILPSSHSNNLDSVLFYNLDDEIIKIASRDQKRDGEFIIPENLWVSFIHSKKIRCYFYSMKEDIYLELKKSERNKLAEFFRKAIVRRDLLFPAIPKGKKKW